MKRLLFPLLLAGALLGRCDRAAGQTETDRLNERLDSLEQQLKRQTDRSEKWSRAVEKLPKVSGYAQLGYQWGELASGSDESTFYIKRVRLTLGGALYRRIADYRIQMELAAPRIVDAYVRVAPWRQFGVQLGQYKVPFSIENVDYGPLRLEAIDYPMALQALMGLDERIGGEKLASTGRDIGITFYGGLWKHGDRSILHYQVGVFNGAGINTSDNNRPKDVVGRLMVRPVEGLTLAAAHYRGTYDKQHFERRRTALGACYDRGPVVVRCEYFVGKTGHEGYALDSDGLYVLGGWRFHERWMVAARYDTFTPDVDRRSESRQSDYTCGLSWSPVKRLRLQLDYEHRDRPLQHDNVVKMQFTVSY